VVTEAEKVITRAVISRAAFAELERLSLLLDRECGVTADTPLEEVEACGRHGGSVLRVVGARASAEDPEDDDTKMPVYVYVPDEPLHSECTDEVKLLILGIRHLGHQERYEEALDLAKEAVRLAPDYWRAWISLATLLVLFEITDGGYEIFERVTKDFAGDPKAVAAGLHGCAWVKEIRYGLAPSDEAVREVSRLYEEALRLDGTRANTRACLLLHQLSSDEKDTELLEDSVLCEGFFDALRMEINERGARMVQVLQALPVWLRHLLYPVPPLHAGA
jgi:hypothetical protein